MRRNQTRSRLAIVGRRMKDCTRGMSEIVLVKRKEGVFRCLAVKILCEVGPLVLAAPLGIGGGTDRFAGGPDDLNLAVRPDFSNGERSPCVMGFPLDGDDALGGVQTLVEKIAANAPRRPLVAGIGLGLGYGLSPEKNADVGGLNHIAGDTVWAVFLFEAGDEGLVFRGVEALEIT